MRINKYIASSSPLSRRAADAAIAEGRVLVNGQPPAPGQDVTSQDTVTLNGAPLSPATQAQTIMLNKPAGVVVSRNGQGAPTIYDILPPELHNLQPVGRLDKYSSGLLLLTNDGQLAQQLTHPSHRKSKVYEVMLGKPLAPGDEQTITTHGVPLADGPSQLQLEPLDTSRTHWRVRMHEGRNRQIRRTFEAVDNTVKRLHRTHFGDYALGSVARGEHKTV